MNLLLALAALLSLDPKLPKEPFQLPKYESPLYNPIDNVGHLIGICQTVEPAFRAGNIQPLMELIASLPEAHGKRVAEICLVYFIGIKKGSDIPVGA